MTIVSTKQIKRAVKCRTSRKLVPYRHDLPCKSAVAIEVSLVCHIFVLWETMCSIMKACNVAGYSYWNLDRVWSFLFSAVQLTHVCLPMFVSNSPYFATRTFCPLAHKCVFVVHEMINFELILRCEIMFSASVTAVTRVGISLAITTMAVIFPLLKMEDWAISLYCGWSFSYSLH